MRLPLLVLAWLVPAWLLMLLAALALRLVPIRKLATWFGHGIGAAAYMPLLPLERRTCAAQLRRVVALAARYAPLRSDCFPQALVAQLLCRCHRLPFALHFGARTEPGGRLAAHAWVVSGPIAISGGMQSFDRYTTVGCFVSPSSLVGGREGEVGGQQERRWPA